MTTLETLREQVQRERDLRYDKAEEHAERGNEHQERVCRAKVDTLDLVLGWIAQAEQPTIALTTLQFSVDRNTVHLVRSTRTGTPGPTLCGIDRFAPLAPGWSVGGGVTGPDITHTPCPGCAEAARAEFAGLPVSGSIGVREMTAALAVERARA